MESVYLRTFVEVVRQKSVSRAAEVLCVTQPAVSKRIRFLEDQYGCPLLRRNGNRFELTDAGELVYEKAIEMISIEEDLMKRLSLISGRDRFSFSCTPAFGVAHLPVILREYMLEYPETSDLQFLFNIPDQILKGVSEGVYDAGVIEHCGSIDVDGCVMVSLPGDEMVFVSSPSLGIRLDELSELFRQTLFARKEGCCSRTMLDMNLAKFGNDVSRFRQVVIHDDLHLVINAVCGGEGITFLSRELVARQIGEGGLREHRLPGFIHNRNRTLLLSGGESLRSPSAQSFLKCLCRHFDVAFVAI